MYDINFYDQINAGAIFSAHKVVPYLVSVFNINSVIDFGCGEGAWLSVFKEYDCSVLGVDGHHVNRNRLLIDDDEFKQVNLAEARYFFGDFDLAISLEVAEHLPETSAEDFVSTLCSASDIIVFSAAIPGQKGEGHINEQWPSYWQKKFNARDYIGSDDLRILFWNNKELENWYRQNLLLFLNRKLVDHYPMIDFHGVLDLVHPCNWHDHLIGGSYDG